jgi:hypothetical protein
MMKADSYDDWLNDVRAALQSINMPMDDWQNNWPFDFNQEFRLGTGPTRAAEKANRFWWREQNKALGQDCRTTATCWLPHGHQGQCQPVS